MIVTTIFRNNRTQAVRLPKAVAMPDDVHEVEVRVIGDSRVISPVGKSWDDWFNDWEPVSDGFGVDIDRASAQERDAWWN